MKPKAVVRTTFEDVTARWAARGDAAYRPYLVSSNSYRPLAELDSWAARGSSDPRLQDGFAAFSGLAQHSWTYDIAGPVWCEPVFGRVIDSRGRVLRQSFTYWHLRQTGYSTSMRSYLGGRGTGSEQRVAQVVSLREPGAEQNYWHFHDDVLSRLLEIDGSDIPSNAPLLIGRALWDTTFFQSAIRRGPLSDREWMVHDSLVRADRLFLPIRGSLRSDTPRGLQRLLASGPRDGSRRLFLFRGRSRSRALRNTDELAAALTHDFDFEAVDTDDLTFEEQANLFADARLIVATHGAGLTNLIHRVGAPASLLELFPSDYVHPHFAWLARNAAFDYSGLVGSALDSTTQMFEISKDLVLATVESIDPAR